MVNDDSAFFDHLGHEVESEVKKMPERKISESQMVRAIPSYWECGTL